MKRFFTAALLLGAMTACCGTQNDKPLEGTVWKLASMEGIPAEAIAADDDAFTLIFSEEDMSAAGRTNCNLYFGSYEAIDGTLAFGEMGMTRMACPDMELETTFMHLFEQVDGFTIEGDRLALTGDGRTLAVFAALDETAAEE